MAGDDAPAAAAVNAVSVKLPDFWSTNPALWFVQVEAVFETSNVTRDRTKYIHCIAKLPERVLESIADIIAECQPDTPDGYQQLKTRLTGSYGLTKWQQLAKLVDHPGLGDERPSALMNSMLACLPAGEKPTLLFQYLFLRHLPSDIRGQLNQQEHKTARDLATAADEIWDIRGKSHGISAVSNRSTSPKRKQERRGRSQTPGRSSDLCFYHSRFGQKAHRCQPPCSWSENTSAADGN